MALFALTLLLTLPQSVLAKRHYLRSYQVEDGLSQNMVYCIAQDSQGFMWFGTQDGLNRFDGKNFRVFKSDADSSGTIGGDGCFALWEGSDGRLWVGTNNGVSIYNPSRESFDHFNMIDDGGYKVMGTARSIFADGRGNLWIVVAERGLFRIDAKGSKRFFAIDYNGECNLRDAVVDGAGNVWVATYGGGVLRFNPQSESVEQFLITPRGSEGNDVNDLALLDERTLLVGTSLRGLLAFDIEAQRYEPYAPMESVADGIFVRKIVRSREGELWIGTETGVYICNPLGTTPIVHLAHANNDPYSLSDNAAHTIYEDIDGGMWIGTYFGGVNYIGAHSSDFEKYYPLSGQNSVSGKCISEFCSDYLGRVWIGTEDAGLNLFDPQTGKFRSGFVPAKNIHSLLYVDGRLWVGTFANGLYVLNISHSGHTSVVKHYDQATSLRGLDSNSIYALRRDAAGQIWVGTMNGLFVYDARQDLFRQVQSESINSRINDILFDSKGVLWVATTRNGVWCYNKVGAEWTQHSIPPLEQSRMPYSCNTLLECMNGQLMVGTSGAGVYVYNPEKERFEPHLTTDSGLPNNVVLKLVEDGQGGVWGSTNNGLFRYAVAEERVATYTHNDGLLCNQFNDKSGWRAPNGTIYFGGIKGFVSFEPERVTRLRPTPRVIFNSLQINGSEVKVGGSKNAILDKSVTLADKITIPHTVKNFSLGLASLGYDYGSNATYAYKLEGFDKSWIYTSEERIGYSNLPYGNYVLRVNTIDQRGNPASVLQLDVDVAPPFYMTGFAKVVYVLLALGVIAGGFYLANRRRKQAEAERQHKFEAQKEKELYDAKIAFFTNITHEIRTPLSLIKMPLEEVLRNVGKEDPNHDNLQIISNNTNRILTLVNELLDFRKVEADGLKVNYVHTNICSLMKSRVENFRPAAKTKDVNIRWSVVVDELKADVDVEIFTKIFDNLLSNALRHAHSLIEISLRVSSDENRLVVGIANDGDQISKELREKVFEPFFKVDETTQGTGLGLPFVRSLAELHEGNVTIADNPHGLTQFVLELPINHQGSFNIGVDAEIVPQPTAEEPTAEIVPENVAKESDDEEISESFEGNHRPTVLLVDDNEEFLEFVAGQLKTHYKIIKASNGVEALERLDQEYVDVIVSDLAMPQMDGQELCRNVKEKLLYSHIPFIMLTADTSLRSKMEGLKVGADEYVEKPFSTEFLVLRINNLMGSRRKIVDSYKHSPEMMLDTIVHSKADENFLNHIVEIIHKNIDKSDLNVDLLAEEMSMSRATLYRKLKSISELTPTKFIHLIRLKRAAELLKRKEYRVNEVAFIVGFASSSYFSKCFYKQFGVLPKDYN